MGRGSSATGRGDSGARGWVRLGLVVVVLLLLLVGVDRVAELVTAHRLGGDIQVAQGLEDRPRVTVHGFPFLTQVLQGQYDDVGIEANGPIVAQGIRVEHASARLHSVRVGVSEAIRGTVEAVPVRSGSGAAVVPYSSLTAAVHRYGGSAGSVVTVLGAGPGRARLEGPLGLSLTVAARVTGGKLSIVPSPGDLAALPGPVRDLVSGALSAPVPLPPFPFNVRLAGGRFEADGLHLTATARNSVFPVRSSG